MLRLTTTMLAAAALLAAGAAGADAGHYGRGLYRVTVTNITPGQTFTPILAVTHKRGLKLFELGEPASDQVAAVAEAGDTGPLADLLDNLHWRVRDTANTGAVPPGESVSFEIHGHHRLDRLSFIGMLVPTNDSFVALNSAALPKRHAVHTAPAYNAGSEPDTELCADIPGPPNVCMGEGLSPTVDGEGFVHIGNGVHGGGDLEADLYDWRNPVARVSIVRIR